MREIRILLTIPNFDTAGSGKVLYDLAFGLKNRGVDVSILCNSKKGEFYKTVESLGVPIYCMPFTFPYKPYLTIFKRIKPFRNFIREQQFDVVHSWHWSSDWTELIAVKRGGAKFIYTKKAMGWGNKHWFIKTYFSDYVLTLNEDMKFLFPWKKNQKLIPLGIDTDYYRSSITKSKPVFTIVLVAHLVPVKGVEILLHALSKLKQEQFRLHIIGDDTTDYAAELKTLTQTLQLDRHVFFLGKQTEVKPFLEEADLMVMTSFKEGMPMALVEGMSMSLPVLGSDIPGIRFVLKGFEDLLFPVGDFQTLANKILMIKNMSSDERIQIGNSLRETCINRFSLAKFIDSHEKLYQELTKIKA